MSNEKLEAIGKAVIRSLETVEQKVRGIIADQMPPIREVVLGTFHKGIANSGVDPAREAEKIVVSAAASLRQSLGEPFIMRLKARDEDGNDTYYYFTRATAHTGAKPDDGVLASYRSPTGRLAELEVGESSEVPKPSGTVTLTVIEKTALSPSREQDVWDAINDRIQLESGDRFTIASFRRYLESLLVKPDEDLVGKLFLESEKDEILLKGFRRAVLDGISLRDQPILDKYQGDVFRMPLNMRIMLMGPPGTGKTTTLIRRLAQKLEEESFNQEPIRDSAPFQDRQIRQTSWTMFAPTALLKLYLKEAFSREGVAAPESQVRTWDAERIRLGRDVLRILRSENSGRFVLEQSRKVLKADSAKELIRIHNEFERSFEADFTSRFADALAQLARSQSTAERNAATEIYRKAGTSPTFSGIFKLGDSLAGVNALAEKANKDAQEKRKTIVNSLLSKHTSLLNDVEKNIDSLAPIDPNDVPENDDEGDELDAHLRSKNLRQRALRLVMDTIDSMARSRRDGRKPDSKSQAFRAATLFGDRLPDPNSLIDLGERLGTRSVLLQLSRSERRLITDVPSAWQTFRRKEFSDRTKYFDDAEELIRENRITGFELDSIVLLMLKNATRLMSEQGASAKIARLAVLESIQGEFRQQVLVDEATDFSPVQLACMLKLTHPSHRSLFASGDFLQRVTSHGITSFDELKWVADDFEHKPINLAYRQSKKLRDLSVSIAELTHESVTAPEAPKDFSGAEVTPLLLEGCTSATVPSWLCDRLREIERAVGRLPSVAIFVDGDDTGRLLVQMLNLVLQQHNLSAVACTEGRDVGTSNEVRVFDVRHIKGLEFEAVFFVGVDRLLDMMPSLFDKYLYVGVTRASTFLGLTCEGTLPEKLAPLRKHFTTGGWSNISI